MVAHVKQVKSYRKPGGAGGPDGPVRQITDLWSLVVGLFVTGKNFAKPQITVHFPRQAVDNLATYKGHIELVGKEEAPATPKCTACGMCARVCPSGCITVTAKTAEPEPPAEGADAAGGEDKPVKRKTLREPEVFELDYNLCSLCGLCVEVCPVVALRNARNVYLAGLTREEFEYDLIQRFKKQASEKKE